jgi:hypothetical protein
VVMLVKGVPPAEAIRMAAARSSLRAALDD